MPFPRLYRGEERRTNDVSSEGDVGGPSADLLTTNLTHMSS